MKECRYAVASKLKEIIDEVNCMGITKHLQEEEKKKNGEEIE